MKNELPRPLADAAEAAAEAYAIAFYDRDHTHEIEWAKRLAPKIAEAVLTHLTQSAQAPEFDEAAAKQAFERRANTRNELFDLMEGARFQHAQSAAREAALRAELLTLVDSSNKLAGENKRLTFRLSEFTEGRVHTCHAECQRIECKMTRERDAWAAEARKLVAALEYCLDQVKLPHQITHDELIGACNGAVVIIQKRLSAFAAFEKGQGE